MRRALKRRAERKSVLEALEKMARHEPLTREEERLVKKHWQGRTPLPNDFDRESAAMFLGLRPWPMKRTAGKEGEYALKKVKEITRGKKDAVVFDYSIRRKKAGEARQEDMVLEVPSKRSDVTVYTEYNRYPDPEENRTALENAVKTTKPGGYIITDAPEKEIKKMKSVEIVESEGKVKVLRKKE